MRLGRNVRVLMLGWEYPPRFAGGLGKACQGLSQAMAKTGAQVFFVLPTFPTRVSEERLEVIGAKECLIEAGWELDYEAAPGPGGALTSEQITYIQSEAQMFPYGAAPTGPIPE